ncbi:hypothetical protein D9M68_749260 [compost metagenome]
MNRRGRLLHAEVGEWPVEVSELGFFGGRVEGNLPADLPNRGWRLRAGDLPALDLLPLRREGDSLALVFPHTDAAASEALAAQIVQMEPQAVAYA